MLQPSLPYNILKFSLQMFRRAPHDLDKDEYESVRSRAEIECALQVKVLASEEGMKLVVPEKSVQEAMAAIAQRYGSPEAFDQDMVENDLDAKSMAAALEVDLAVEATMTHVALQVQPPSEAQVAKVYETTDPKKPEQRRVSHILITINDQFPENSRQAALNRINKVQQKCLSTGADFSALAERYSECPSALQGGTIGLVAQGSMQASLDEVLFGMEAGKVSEVVESNMGFHILFCAEVIKGEKVSPEEAKNRIRKNLQAQSRKKAVQAWLATL